MMDRSVLCLQAVDTALEGHDYLLNRGFSAADIMMGYTLMLADKLLDESFGSNVGAYYHRLIERPGFVVANAENQLL
jgi:glutathione S-transferase